MTSFGLGSAATSRMRPPILLGPSSAHTWSVPGEPELAFPIAFDCAIASLIAASGMEPSAFARWRYIHSSAPAGSDAGMAATAVGTCVVLALALLMTAAV